MVAEVLQSGTTAPSSLHAVLLCASQHKPEHLPKQHSLQGNNCRCVCRVTGTYCVLHHEINARIAPLQRELAYPVCHHMVWGAEVLTYIPLRELQGCNRYMARLEFCVTSVSGML
jgi:hypothetical protein